MSSTSTKPQFLPASSVLNFLSFQPTYAWTAIISLVIITAVAIVGGAGGVLRIGFPVAAFAVGLFLYIRYPLIYVSYTWWIWFLTPFIRRLVDWKAGYQEPNIILLAPYLVTFVTFWTFIKTLPKASQNGNLPFILASIGVGYGLMVGAITQSITAVIVPLLNWFTPILFGSYLLTQWREYPAYSQTIRRTFLWMTLLTGLYGIYQYIVAPEWDASWLTLSGLTSSGGTPEPYGMRVFSTMNLAGPFSVAMTAGVLLLFSEQSPLKLPASGAGYLAFLLTQVRSAWVAWAVGLFVLGASLKPKLQMQMFITICLMVICVLPLTAIEPFGEVINSRLETFSNLEADTSYVGRMGIYETYLILALKTFVGFGLGGLQSIGETLDSAIIDTMLTLGWIGTIYYMSGLFSLFQTLLKGQEASFDTFASASRAISAAMLVMLLFGNVLLDLSGVVLWGFLGIGVAANRYNIDLQKSAIQRHLRESNALNQNFNI